MSGRAAAWGDRIRRAAPLGAVLLLGLAAYANALRAGFVYDDLRQILENRLVPDLESWGWGGPGYGANPRRYIGYLSFALNHAAGGYAPWGYHLVNVAIHLASTALVWRLVLLTFRTPRGEPSALAGRARLVAAVAAALFAVHPIQTGAVTYVVQRFASLATLLYLCAVVGYARWRLGRAAGEGGPRQALRYVFVLVVAFAAMHTKEITVTLPLAILGWELVFFGRPSRRGALALLPILATILVVPLSALDAQGGGAGLATRLSAASHVQTAVSRLDYLRTEAWVVLRYLGLVAVPVGQSADPDQPVLSSFLDGRVLGGAAVIVALLVLAVHLLRRAGPGPGQLDPAVRVVAFGIGWFFLTIAVESSVIPIADPMFEHRVYLPSAGLFPAVAAAAALALQRGWGERWGRLLATGATAVALVLAAVTAVRNEVWADEITLWSDVVVKAPAKARGHYNLGSALAKAGREEEGIAELRAAVRLDPGHVQSWNNLGAALVAVGRPGEAAGAYEQALRLDPSHAEACYNLGRLHLVSGDRARAIPLLERAIASRPDYADAYANLAAALNGAGRPLEAVRLLEGAGEVIRSTPEARFNLGVAYVLVGDGAGARRELAALRGAAPALAGQLEQFAVRAQGGR